MRFGLFIALIAVFILPGVALAQSLETAIGETNPFTISVAPQYPSPRTPATLSFLSSSLDLTKVTMTVSANGTQLYQGSVRPVAVMLGKAGSVTNVTVTMVSAGIPYTQRLVLQPQDVSIIAEPLSSAPALYSGKPLVPFEGNTRVVAVAHLADATGKSISPTALSYTWTVDGAEIANSSGIGKQAIIVASPLQYRTRSVSVVVQSQAGNLIGKASLALSPVEPTVRIYENDPLLGIRFERALRDSYTIQGTEASLYAAPFSLSLTSGTPLLQWFLNGTSAQMGSLITLRPTGSGKGSASLSLTASSGTESITGASTALSLIFGAKSSSNFFGL